MCVRLVESDQVLKYKANHVVKIKVGDDWLDVEPEVPEGCAPLDVDDGARLRRAEENKSSVYR
jgi:hypothetical protein